MALMKILQKMLYGDTPEAQKSGVFSDEALKGIGSDYSQFLRERLTTPVTQTSEFTMGSEAIREALSRTSGAARQRLGESALTGGWMDAGALAEGVTDIDRAEMEAFASGLRELILGLEDRKAAGVLPYLGLGVQEQLGIEGINVQSEMGMNQLMLGVNELVDRINKNISGEARGWVSDIWGAGGVGGLAG